MAITVSINVVWYEYNPNPYFTGFHEVVCGLNGADGEVCQLFDLFGEDVNWQYSIDGGATFTTSTLLNRANALVPGDAEGTPAEGNGTGISGNTYVFRARLKLYDGTFTDWYYSDSKFIISHAGDYVLDFATYHRDSDDSATAPIFNNPYATVLYGPTAPEKGYCAAETPTTITLSCGSDFDHLAWDVAWDQVKLWVTPSAAPDFSSPVTLTAPDSGDPFYNYLPHQYTHEFTGLTPGTEYMCRYQAVNTKTGKTSYAIQFLLTTPEEPGGEGDPGDCPWTAVSNDPWLHITAGSSGEGSGSVTYNVDANPGAERIGTLTIAGITHTVTQEAAGDYVPPPAGVRTIGIGGIVGVPTPSESHRQIGASGGSLPMDELIAIIAGVIDGTIVPALEVVTDTDGVPYTDTDGDYYFEEI